MLTQYNYYYLWNLAPILVNTYGLCTWALRANSLDPDPWSGFKVISCARNADYAHETAGLVLTHCPGALSRNPACSSNPDWGCVGAKLNPDAWSASDKDPRSRVESPIMNYLPSHRRLNGLGQLIRVCMLAACVCKHTSVKLPQQILPWRRQVNWSVLLSVSQNLDLALWSTLFVRAIPFGENPIELKQLNPCGVMHDGKRVESLCC